VRYPNGTQIRVGDRIKLSNGEPGTVVFCVDTGEYSPGFPKEEWQYLKSGVMVKTNGGALIHFTEPNNNDVMPLK
jgi:hypothetical protein